MWPKATIHREAVRYGIVGLASNVVLYLGYLFFTGVGLGHKTAMSLLFVIGTIQTFVFNRRWTFQYQVVERSIFVKYLTTYGVAYLINLVALMLFVDYLSFSHEIVQGVMILLLPVPLFVLQRYWVFRELKPMMITE